MTLYINSLIDLDNLKEKSDKILKEKNSIEEIIAKNKNKPNNKTAFEKVIKMEDISTMTYEEQKKIVRMLVSRVEVTPDEIRLIFKL